MAKHWWDKVLNTVFRRNSSPGETTPEEIVEEDVIDFADMKRTSTPLLQNSDISLWDLGDGVVCAELHGMKQTVGPDTIAMLNDSMDLIAASNGQYKALVIYSDTTQFAVGGNLGMVAMALNMADYDYLDDIIYDGQKALERLKYAPFPVVAAVGGMALGGGCEITLHCDAIQAHAESRIGLVEGSVGLIPAWGGCKEFLGRCFEDATRNGSDISPVVTAFETLAMSTVSSSAQDAKDKLFMRPTDGITMDRTRLLGDAKAKALSLTKGYTPPEPYKFRLSGPGGKTMLSMAVEGLYARGIATWHDVRVSEVLTTVLTGGDTNLSHEVTEKDMQVLEREGLLRLGKTAQTRKRIQNTVNTGKPLRESPLEVPKDIAELGASVPGIRLKKREDKKPWPATGDQTPNNDDMKPSP